ncbi:MULTISPECIES: type IV pilin-like G/H family protein [Spirulina sp. CCY15215]|uniref:type IV pilin-like G/H family protein n=1 Tax=Spirulina sp. CCY15215 TaxID=2767591 RepID=UPI00194EA82B|nr:type IV pilin-like G/H family protein [Spirulina major]
MKLNQQVVSNSAIASQLKPSVLQISRKWGRIFLCLSPFILASCQVNLQIPKLDGEQQAKFYIQTVTRGQEAYYKNNGELTASLKELAIDFKLDTPDYKFVVLSHGDPTHSVTITATAKKENLHSYTGIVYGQKEGDNYQAVVNMCQTEQPSTIAPKLDTKPITSKALDCPSGSIPMQ